MYFSIISRFFMCNLRLRRDDIRKTRFSTNIFTTKHRIFHVFLFKKKENTKKKMTPKIIKNVDYTQKYAEDYKPSPFKSAF